ncbi:MAG: hypothetical protein HY074_00745 [Deltaproteobacteria bacterium]|nr:hypothetical protein [Deltaproteobacteria bacterium]
MKLKATPLVLLLLPFTLAQADTDLCLFGKDRDVRDWIKDGKNFAAIACKKKVIAGKPLKALKASLLRDGYHIASGPAVQAIPLSSNPTPELREELRQLSCGRRQNEVYTICVTIKENERLGLAPAKKLPDMEPPSEIKKEPVPVRAWHNEGKLRAE